MKLIIAEKPNVAKELKSALEPTAQHVKAAGAGYFKGQKFIFKTLSKVTNTTGKRGFKRRKSRFRKDKRSLCTWFL